MLTHTCNPSTKEAEARGLLGIQGYTELHSGFKTILGYNGKPVSNQVSKPVTGEEQAGGPGSASWLQKEFQISLGYRRHYLKKFFKAKINTL